MDPTKMPLPIEVFKNGGQMILKGVRPAREYKDGKPTEKITGLKVDVVLEKNGYETLTVTVADPADRLTAVLEKSDKPIYVDFSGFKARVFVMDGRARVSAKADRVFTVTDSGVDEDGFDNGFDD